MSIQQTSLVDLVPTSGNETMTTLGFGCVLPIQDPDPSRIEEDFSETHSHSKRIGM